MYEIQTLIFLNNWLNNILYSWTEHILWVDTNNIGAQLHQRINLYSYTRSVVPCSYAHLLEISN